MSQAATCLFSLSLLKGRWFKEGSATGAAKHTNVKLCDKVGYPFGYEFDTDIL